MFQDVLILTCVCKKLEDLGLENLDGKIITSAVRQILKEVNLEEGDITIDEIAERVVKAAQDDQQESDDNLVYSVGQIVSIADQQWRIVSIHFHESFNEDFTSYNLKKLDGSKPIWTLNYIEMKQMVQYPAVSIKNEHNLDNHQKCRDEISVLLEGLKPEIVALGKKHKCDVTLEIEIGVECHD